MKHSSMRSPLSAPADLEMARGPVARVATFALMAALLLPLVAEAQPFGAWGIYSRPEQGYIEIPHSPALNPTGQITIEGWVSVEDGGGCSNIIGKGFETAWWVGICGTSLRSYLRGGGSARTAGTLESGWYHFAVTYDGVRRRHFINGELIASWLEEGPLTTNSEPVRIGSDVDYESFSPEGAINELRLWNVARGTQQLRDAINERQTTAEPGLVAVWTGSGPHDGSIVDFVPGLTFPVTNLPCLTTDTNLCLRGRFNVHVNWRTDSEDGPGMVAPLTTLQSGIFWFFNSTNWELMVKVLNGCPINDRFWVFSAATTNVFYRLEVFDQQAGVNKVYFNYPGPPAPAVTDTSAFHTCPPGS